MGSTAGFMALGGTALKAAGQILGGYSQRAALDASANELTQEAGQSVAAGIQGAIADRRRAAYVASNASSRIAGSGLTTTGTSAQATIGAIRGQGEYAALTSLYQGADRAAELNFRAGQLRTEGSNAVTQGWLGGAGSVLSGGTSWYQKYGQGAPASTPAGAGFGGAY